MKKLLIMLLTAVFTLTVAAQNDSVKVKPKRKVELFGEVYDSFTKARVKAFMTLMRKDSTVVDTMTCWTWGTNSYYEFKVPAVHDDFIIKATAEHYEDTYMNYQLRHIARNSSFEMPRMLMKKKREDDIWRESSLDGVVVTGTKVKIAYRGDTIVYNASAFNLPEGSMLDGLIRQMPGAELKDNGDIYINGKKIDYLTLNGKDFFKGQNKVMLENLPYFTVKDIKVYNKSTKQSEMIGHDVEKKDYVMDVSLKREYNRGYMANTEVGGGSDDRYMGRLFSLYYDDHSRVLLFGNANNVNETRQPGVQGEWFPSNMPQGLRTTKQTGLGLNTEDADKNWEENFNASAEWSNADQWTRTSSETFATDGNIFGGSESRSRQKDFRFTVRNEFRLMKPVMLHTNLSANYTNGRMTSSSNDSTYRDFIINQTQNGALNKYRTLQLQGSMYSYKKFYWGDYLILYANGQYSRQKPSESFSRNNTCFAQTGQNDLREYYTDTHGDNYSYQFMANYTLQLLNKWYITPEVAYVQQMANTHNSNYRLDWLGNMKPHDLGWLPSALEALNSVIDKANTDSHLNMTRSYKAELGIHHSDDNQYFSFVLPIEHKREHMHFTDFDIDTLARRSFTDFTPSISYYRWNVKKGLRSASYSMSVSRPEFASLIPSDDTTNPLALRINNPDLKAVVNHNFNISFTVNNDSLKRHLNVWTNASITRNSWGTRTTYNHETGAYTFMNDNINGNWSWGLGNSYQQPIDKAKRLTFQHNNDIDYTHSIDFDVRYVSTELQQTEQAGHPKSTVNNWTVREYLSLEYQRDKLTVKVSGDLSWRNATSTRQNFERINAFEYKYGASLMYTIPWVKLSLGTDIMMYSRRGYQSSMMNTDDLVWNAELSRSFFKEKLTVKLTAFDLLHQLSSTQYNVNAQGRTETWQNCIPRYVMLSLAYKFTRKPKQ